MAKNDKSLSPLTVVLVLAAVVVAVVFLGWYFTKPGMNTTNEPPLSQYAPPGGMKGGK